MALVKRMSTMPVPAGETAVIWVDEFWVKLAAGVLPKETPVMFVICRPVMVTDVPPAGAP